MNHKRPKIWTSEDQIIAAIERTKRQAERQLKKSIALVEKVKSRFGRCEELRFQLMKPMADFKKEDLESKLRSAELDAGKAQDEADAYAKAYHRAINSTLPRLGEVLAAFRTGTFADVMNNYRGVAVR